MLKSLNMYVKRVHELRITFVKVTVLDTATLFNILSMFINALLIPQLIRHFSSTLYTPFYSLLYQLIEKLYSFSTVPTRATTKYLNFINHSYCKEGMS